MSLKNNSLQEKSNIYFSLNNTRKNKSLPERTKPRNTPTPVKFSNRVSKIINVKNLLKTLPDDLSKKIVSKAYLSKVVSIKDEKKNVNETVKLKDNLKNIPLKNIRKMFQLDHFNFNSIQHYKDSEDIIKIKNNEEILTEISSLIAGENDLEDFNFYCYKKIINLYDPSYYNIVLVKISLYENNINDNNDDIYIRNYYSDADINRVITDLPHSIRCFYNNYIIDEYNPEIIRTLKYRDLINIFNPELNTYTKVVKKLKSLV